MFPLYVVSHFTPAFELLVVLIVYAQFSSDGYFLETFSVYLLVIGLLWTPVVFNPNGLDFTYARCVSGVTHVIIFSIRLFFFSLAFFTTHQMCKEAKT